LFYNALAWVCFSLAGFCSDPAINPMLGVKFDNRESVLGPMKVVLTPNIGLEMEIFDAISKVL
jgi:hypothetical protein